MAEGNGTQRDLGYLEASVESLKDRFDRFEEKHDAKFIALEAANAEILAAINQAKGGGRIIWPMVTGALGGGLAVLAQYLGLTRP